jgi:hypothetical protein
LDELFRAKKTTGGIKMKRIILSVIAVLTLTAPLRAGAQATLPQIPPVEIGIVPIAPAAFLALGELETGGNACFNWDESPVLATDHQILIPIRTFVKRAEGSRVVRGSCQFALPLSIPKDHRLLIRSIGVNHLVNLSPGTQAKAQLEIFYPGFEGPKLELVENALDGRLANLTQAQMQGELVTECGAKVVLRGNSNILLIGGGDHSTAKLDNVQIEYELQPCAAAN